MIWGHHRSGNHYLAALLDTNFFKTGDYRFLLHSRQHVLISRIHPDVRYIYIKRNFNDVAKSVYTIRARFGLEVDTYKEFLASRYCDMFTGKVSVALATNFLCRSGRSHMLSGFFRGIEKTPKEWHADHIEHFERVFDGRENCLIVSYDKLKNRFQREMRKISKFLGLDTLEFVNVDEKVGFFIPP